MLEAAKFIVAVKNIDTPDERHACEHAGIGWGPVPSTGRPAG
ncbi:MAG TPA: hypothetical protein VEG33_21380 [Streptosporangiaceae bacterium]|nr:hypothetical protein [Streptosporangiaceae bacterium]